MLCIRVKPPGAASTVFNHEAGPFEIGRQPAASDAPRCVVVTDETVSKNHLRVEELPTGRVRITNTSLRKPVRLPALELQPGESQELDLPLPLRIGNTAVLIERVNASSRDSFDQLETLSASPLLRQKISQAHGLPADTLDPNVLAEWFETFISVQRAPVGTREFYQQTARALVDHLAMDVGLVLLLQHNNWHVVARAAAAGADLPGREFSVSVLSKIAEGKRTVYRTDELSESESLTGVVALVAAPMFDAGGKVIGAVYGARRTAREKFGISRLEAQMAQVLATAVGIGLGRAEKEEELARMQVQFRQHFTDQIAQQLVADDGALEGQDREVSIMFVDLCGFSRLSEKLGPKETFRLVSDVLEVLTLAVHRHNGTVMDYVGDELIALWNAPLDQADHAVQAVACATELERDLVPLNAAWGSRIGEPLRVGVGVNTGTARVGNTGTRYKFKYGALGHNVNLASRIQGATRAFGCPILMSKATRAELPTDAPVRRAGRVKLAGMDEAVELYQAMTPGWSVTPEATAAYERMLALFEGGMLRECAEELARLQESGRDDGTVKLLAARVSQLLQDGAAENYAPIITLASK